MYSRFEWINELIDCIQSHEYLTQLPNQKKEVNDTILPEYPESKQFGSIDFGLIDSFDEVKLDIEDYKVIITCKNLTPGTKIINTGIGFDIKKNCVLVFLNEYVKGVALSFRDKSNLQFIATIPDDVQEIKIVGTLYRVDGSFTGVSCKNSKTEDCILVPTKITNVDGYYFVGRRRNKFHQPLVDIVAEADYDKYSIFKPKQEVRINKLNPVINFKNITDLYGLNGFYSDIILYKDIKKTLSKVYKFETTRNKLLSYATLDKASQEVLNLINTHYIKNINTLKEIIKDINYTNTKEIIKIDHLKETVDKYLTICKNNNAQPNKKIKLDFN